MSANQGTNEDIGNFRSMIIPRPGHTLTDLEAAFDTVIEKLKADGPTTDEVRRALAGLELQFLQGLESNLGKAMQL